MATASFCQADSNLDAFERNAARAKQLGATHIVITEDISPALWELDIPGDPYPAWYMYHPGLLKIFPPTALEKYIDKGYAEKVAALFQARSEVLRRLGLKAYRRLAGWMAGAEGRGVAGWRSGPMIDL